MSFLAVKRRWVRGVCLVLNAQDTGVPPVLSILLQLREAKGHKTIPDNS